MTKQIQCMICDGEMKPFLIGQDRYHKITKKKFYIFRCAKCGLEKIHPTPTKEDQLNFYPQDYYSYSEQKDKERIIQKLRDYIRDGITNLVDGVIGVKKLYAHNGKGKTMLDIGCGAGQFMIKMRKKGWNTVGFEISSNIKKEENIVYAPEFSAKMFHEKFDVIYLSHVFEHLDNPREFLEEIKNTLKDTGKVIIILPNVDCLSSRVFGKYAVERDIPRHLYNYSSQNIKLLCKKMGYEIDKVQKLPQLSTSLSLCRLIGIRYFFLINIITYPIDLILSLFRKTNQIGIVLHKK